MDNWVDLIVPSEHERAVSNELWGWQKQHGANSMQLLTAA